MRTHSALVLLVCLRLSLGSVQFINMTIYNSSGPLPSFTVYSGNTLNSSFNLVTNKYNCALPQLFTYDQTATESVFNSPYYLTVQSSSPVSVSLSTTFNHFTPSISPNKCDGFCSIQILNNCPQTLTNTNYFDVLQISITGVPLITYRVWCNTNFQPHTFQWGLFLLILIVTLIISVTSLYSRAWSIGGPGLAISYWFIGALVVIILVGGFMGWLIPGALNIILDIICTILGILCVALCCDQALWISKVPVLTMPRVWKFRLMDLISLGVGVALTVGWLVSDKNWLLNDILSVCMIVAFIKLLKLTSFKMSLLLLISVLTVECIIALIIHYLVGESYNVLLLNNFNNPLMIQLPTISPVLDQKCAWLPITEVIFPGVFISYLRRFDDSRNTRVYLILSCVSFYIGSMMWMVMTTFNLHSWPFSLFSETTMLLLVAMFATQRNQIRTIWDGKFYDEEFQDKEQIERLKEQLRNQTEKEKPLQIRQSVLKDLMLASPRGPSLKIQEL